MSFLSPYPSEFKGYNPPLEERREYLRLDFNENIVIELQDELILSREMISSYPNYNEAYDVISEFLEISINNLLLTNGLDDAIRLISQTFLRNDDKVLLPRPSFSMYKFYSELTMAKIYEYDILKGYSFIGPLQDVYFKVVFICSPNNPTGSVISARELRTILECNPFTLFILDEAYVDFAAVSLIYLLQEYDNLLVLRTFSKAYAMAGLRLGAIIGPEKFISQLKARSSPYAVNIAAVVFIQRLILDDSAIKTSIQIIVQNREYLSKELKKRGFFVYPSEANFILVQFGSLNSYMIRGLRSLGILIRDQSNAIPGCSRITIGSKIQMDDLLNVIDLLLSRDTIVFDMDGVLIDVQASYRKSISRTVEKFSQIPCEQQEIANEKRNLGSNNDWILSQNILKNRGIFISLDTIIDTFQEYYLGKNFDGLIQNEQLIVDKKLLKKLHQNYRLAIFTGRPRDEMQFTLRKFDIELFFDLMISLNDLEMDKQKPDPEGLLMIKEELKADKLIYVGDTINDIVAAKQAGVTSISIGLEELESDYRLPTVNELEVIL
ncbi:MAG: aminotransferase class I/II-fold pyridoxal phosphate-dependent enzyme [Candidatus Heimdallarchaeota archaeon]|nr:aminotransferase class I/II-fold pyridoxal phosphate-dependent enzyme [Candidatus Heimdallarchaeota archaeon]